MDSELAKQCEYKKMTLRPDDVPTEHLPSSAVDLKRPKSVERSGLAVAKRRNYEVNKTGAHQNVSLGAHLIFPIRSALHLVRLFTDVYDIYSMHACLHRGRIMNNNVVRNIFISPDNYAGHFQHRRWRLIAVPAYVSHGNVSHLLYHVTVL